MSKSAVIDFGLCDQVFGRADWRRHFLHDQIRSEVGHVRRYQYHREEPPYSSDDTSRSGPEQEKFQKKKIQCHITFSKPFSFLCKRQCDVFFFFFLLKRLHSTCRIQTKFTETIKTKRLSKRIKIYFFGNLKTVTERLVKR